MTGIVLAPKGGSWGGGREGVKDPPDDLHCGLVLFSSVAQFSWHFLFAPRALLKMHYGSVTPLHDDMTTTAVYSL